MTSTLKHPKKVNLLRDSIDVSGKRLLPVGISDEKMDEQIDILLNVIKRTPDEINVQESRVMSKIDYSKSEKEVADFIKSEMMTFINLTGTPSQSFWRNFGSAPYYQKYEDEKGKKGGVGMDTIFGKKFEDCHSMMFEVYRLTDDMIGQYMEEKDRRNSPASKNIESKFKSLDDLEENLSVKKIDAEAKIFWNDETKDFDERLEVFGKYGKNSTYIHEPNHRGLAKIFNMSSESDDGGMCFDRYQNVDCLDVVEWWIETLSEGRSKISYNENKYHPKIISKKRNYIPSEAAIDRLQNYYKRIIMQEGVASFEFDW